MGVQNAIDHIEAMTAEMRMPRVGEAGLVLELKNSHAALFIHVQRVVVEGGIDVVDREWLPWCLVGVDYREWHRRGSLLSLIGRHGGLGLSL